MELTKDTKAILALTLKLETKGKDEKPLTNKEYNLLAKWLKERALRPQDILEDGFHETYSAAPLPGLTVERLEKLLRRSAAIAFRCESWLNTGMWIVSRADSSYPSRLKRVLGLHAPPLLFGYGDISQLDKGGIGVVGSRKPSEEALAFAQMIGEECAKTGLTLISGGAEGCDNAAIQGALEAQGQVIVVLSHGLIKAALVKKYTDAIRAGKAVIISSTRPDAHFNIGEAMARNKLIYALSDAVVVAAARYKTGGTWAGATEAMRKWKTPVYVRQTGEVGLAQLGAQPIRQLHKGLIELDKVSPLGKELTADSNAKGEPACKEGKTISFSAPAEREILKAVAKYCEQPRERKEIYRFLDQYEDIGKQALIKCALEQGVINKLTNPVRYVATTVNPKLV